jgi:GT2 family glycosyltransferase
MLCKIILVNWKRAIDTCNCIISLEQIIDVDWYAVICENGSPDNSSIELRTFLAEQYTERVRVNAELDIFDYYSTSNLDVPRVTLILSPSNLGFAGGNNLAYRHALADANEEFVWFLNNDTEVEHGTLSRMIERMRQDSSIGICGNTIVYAHDRKTVQVFGGAAYYPLVGHIIEIGRGKSWPCTVDANVVETRMCYVSGASALVTNEFINRVGLMCEDYFLYYEEIDWAERARRAGFRLGYAPQAVVYHKEGAVLGTGSSATRSMLSEYYGISGRLTITRRYFPWALPTVYLFSLLQILRRCLQGHWPRARMMAAVLLGLRRTPPLDK